MSEATFDVSNHVDSATSQNSSKILCSFCDCAILLKSKGKHVESPFDLPCTRQKKSDLDGASGAALLSKESIKDYWLVLDMFTFENIGFTKTVENIKYLICADCELGPLGYQNLEKQNELFLACNRVKYEN